MKIQGFVLLMVFGVTTFGLGLRSFAHETDQYTTPDSVEFADVADYFTEFFYDALERAVEKENALLRAGTRKPTKPYRPGEAEDQLVEAVFHEFPVAYSLIEGLEVKLHAPELRKRYPGRLTAYKPRWNNVYGTAHQIIDPRRLFKFWFASSFKAYGVYMGTDKIGHFTDMGHNYYVAYSRAKRGGATVEEAIKAAVRLGTGSILYSEAGILGTFSAGNYSNADLASNYLGFLFYLNLTEPVNLKGQVRPPLVIRDGAYWKLAPHVTRHSDFMSWFFFDHLDEALNPGLFDGSMRGGMRRAVRARADSLLWRYRDINDCRRSSQFFATLQKDLTTLWGQYYGHAGDPTTLVIMSEACFEAPPKSSPGKVVYNPTGHSPLHWAVEQNNLSEMTMHLDAGLAADVPMVPEKPELSHESGNTALHLAARDNRQAMAELLISRGAQVNAVNALGVTPLHRTGQSPSIAELLVAKGAVVNQADVMGRTALHWAAIDRAATNLHVLLNEGAAVNVADNTGHTPLRLAAESGSVESVNLLLRARADVNAADLYGDTALHVACARGEMNIVNLLLAAGADANAANSVGNTPMHNAADRGVAECIAALLDARADAARANQFGNTPLHIACRGGFVPIVEMLVASGQNLKAVNSVGSSVLHEAVFANNARLVALLMDHQADTTLRNSDGMTAQTLAERKGFLGIVRQLSKAKK